MKKEEKFFIITKESVRTLAEKLSNSTMLDEVENEVEKMLEIKEALLYRAERGIGVPKEIEREQAWEVQTRKLLTLLRKRISVKGFCYFKNIENMV